MHDHHPTDAPPATGLLALELAEGAIGEQADGHLESEDQKQ